MYNYIFEAVDLEMVARFFHEKTSTTQKEAEKKKKECTDEKNPQEKNIDGLYLNLTGIKIFHLILFFYVFSLLFIGTFIFSLSVCESYTFWYLHRYSSFYIWLYGHRHDRYQ